MLFQHEPAIRALIDHSDSLIRSEALKRLYHMWGRDDLLGQVCETALNGPDEFIRSEAVSALGLRHMGGIEDPATKFQVMSTLARWYVFFARPITPLTR